MPNAVSPPRWILLAALLLLALAVGCSQSQPAADAEPDLGEPDLPSPDLPPLPDAPPALAVGEILDFSPDQSGKVVGSTSVRGSEQFMLLLVSTDETAFKTHAYSAQEQSAQAMHLPGPGADGGLPPHSRFAERVNQILRTKPAALRVPKRYCQAGVPPQVGEQRSFKVSDGGSAYLTITAECILVDEVAAYWLDKTSSPQATISPTTLAELANGFSKVVVPRLRTYFGKESDINGDGTISLLFSPLVANEALAYVSPCDLLDPEVVPSCANSNKAELLYMTPPSSLPPWAGGPTGLLRSAAHELQHAIYFFHKFLVNGASSQENPYITEGLSALAEDLSGYGGSSTAAAGLLGVDNLSIPGLAGSAVVKYFGQPDDSYHRGGGYLLMRYLFDRAGGETLDPKGTPKDLGGIGWIRNVVSTKHTGLASLTGASGLDVAELTTQFWTALAVSNRGPGGAPINPDPLLNYKPVVTDPITGRQRGCNLFGTIHGTTSMKGPKAQELGAADGSLRAGGAEYLLLSASPGRPWLSFTVQTPPEARARVRLIRIQ